MTKDTVAPALRPGRLPKGFGNKPRLRVTNVFPGSPAAALGIAPGWQLVAARKDDAPDAFLAWSAPPREDIAPIFNERWAQYCFVDLAGTGRFWLGPSPEHRSDVFAGHHGDAATDAPRSAFGHLGARGLSKQWVFCVGR